MNNFQVGKRRKGVFSTQTILPRHEVALLIGIFLRTRFRNDAVNVMLMVTIPFSFRSYSFTFL